MEKKKLVNFEEKERNKIQTKIHKNVDKIEKEKN